MSDIDDLCQIIHHGIWLNFEDLEEEIIAAGFHRDRTITTAEELDALPEGSVVCDFDGDAWQTYENGFWVRLDSTDSSEDLAEFLGPFTVLHEGARDE